MGFEPTVALLLRLISSQAHSPRETSRALEGECYLSISKYLFNSTITRLARPDNSTKKIPLSKMPRILTLEPTYVAGRASPWRLFVPAYLSQTGKPQSLFFETQAQAKTAASAFKARTENFGRTLNQLSPARMAEAAESIRDWTNSFPASR